MKMNKKIILTTIILAATANVSAANIQIESQNSFEPDNTIKFNYTIQGDQNVRYIPSVSCPSAREPLLQVKKANLSEGEVESTYRYSTVTSDMEPQNCTASVNIINLNQSASKQLEIEGSPTFEMKLKICTSESCSQEKTVFEQGETPYITIEADKNPEIDSTLETPSGIEDINIPTNLENLEKGNYNIKISASLEEYQNQTVEKGFAVIDSSPSFEEETFPNKENKKSLLQKIISLLSNFL